MKHRGFQWLPLVLLLAFMAAPASAQIGACDAICSSQSSCEEPCYSIEEEEGSFGIFDSTCGDYGLCSYTPPSCQDPKRVTTRVETTLTSSTVTASWCHTDHWFPGDPYAWPRWYDYMFFTYLNETIRTTEYCNGSVVEEVIDSWPSSANCARRTWSICSFPFGPPPLTCAF